MGNKFKDIPSVDSLLQDSAFMKKLGKIPMQLVKESIRETAERWRKKIEAGHKFSMDAFLTDIQTLANEKKEPSLRRVINAQGVILSTNLGRSTLPQEAIDSVVEVMSGYSNLEFRLEDGRRGSRYSHLREELKKLSGAEEALVVNNNAGAVFLVVNTLAQRKEVIVSRGELIEIGASFRLPDIIRKSGARLVEVGTTNRTYLSDYESAISKSTALILKSHTSNYKIVGFAETPRTQELVKLGREYNLPTMEDLGSGLLIDLQKYGIPYEPTVQDVLKTGVDIVTFSGDKLLCGPQAGIILGKKKFIELIERNPLLRTLRVGKDVIAGLEAVLRIYLYEDDPIQMLPPLRSIIKSPAAIKKEAAQLAQKIKPYFNGEVAVIQEYSEIGGGSFPGVKLPSWVVSLKPVAVSVAELAKSLRLSTPPIIPRIKDDRVLLDPRTIQPDEINYIIKFFENGCDNRDSWSYRPR